MTNDHWYEQFNTKVDVGTAIVFTRQNSVLLEWTAHSTLSPYYQDITDDQNIEIQTDTEERYLAYIFLKQSAKTSEKIRTNMSDDYTTGKKNIPRVVKQLSIIWRSIEIVLYVLQLQKKVVRLHKGMEMATLILLTKSIGNTRSATSVGIKDTLRTLQNQVGQQRKEEEEG